MEIKLKKETPFFIFQLSGRMDINCYYIVDEQVQKAISNGEHHLIFDMSDVNFMDSSGLRVFISALKQITRENGQIILVNMSDIVRSIFEITQTLNLFEEYPTVDSAISELSSMI